MPLRLGGLSKQELSGQAFAPVPDGTYTFTVKDVDEHEKLDETTGEPKYSIKVTLRLSDAYNDAEYKGFTRSVYLSTMDGKRGPLVAFLNAIGYDSDQLSDPDFELEPAEMVGREVSARVRRNGEYQGSPNYDLNNFRPVGFEEAGKPASSGRRRF